MPSRDDETPTDPATSERLARIAARIKRRSTRTAELAKLTAMDVCVILGVDPMTDPRLEQAALAIRGLVERVLDTIAQPECERCRRREEIRRRSEER